MRSQNLTDTLAREQGQATDGVFRPSEADEHVRRERIMTIQSLQDYFE